MTFHTLGTAAVAACVVLAASAAIAQERLPVERVRLPPGFSIEVVARVPQARGMAWGDRGTLFVGSRGDSVYAVTMPEKGGGVATVRTVATGLTMPVGVAFRDGALYASSINRIVRLPGIEASLDRPPKAQDVSSAFPSDRHHGWKFIAFGPDGKLYVPVGAPCNVCDRDADGYATIMRMNADGSALEIVARGVRNTVGFDWHPRTGELWFTDNGRDLMGDDVPGDELNRMASPGRHFGFPFCHAGDVADPQYGALRPCRDFVPPVQVLGAHVAALGMRFYTGTQFPPAYRDQVFVAEHGSWNRTNKSGYRVTLVRLDAQGRAVAYEPFAEGFMQKETAWGRPVDVLVAPDGSLLVSDDLAGAIYRIRYAAPGTAR